MKIHPLLFIFFASQLHSQIKITIDPTADIKKISPYIYGRNNSISSTNPNWTLSSGEYIQIRDAGVTFFRESGGNNSTKYNWQKKISSHPDWYNNVYGHDWDEAAKTIQKNFPNAQGMWSFQLLGKVAKTNQANFNDWGYNRSTWWQGVNQNLAGNGSLSPSGTKAAKDGDINLYLEDWPADSTAGILNHWFGNGGIGLNKNQIQYWSMDNEPEIWAGTHDDVVTKQIPAEEFMQKYFAVAKQARKLYPSIKLTGPVVANEWQWYNWDGPVNYNGKNIPWIEYFILRCAEEQRKTGVRLLDVVDIHFYPYTSKVEEIVQLHRVFFDENYIFPEANGVKNVNGSWDNSQNKEYIFTRINQWLDKYYGTNHHIKLGLTELGFNNQNANATAVAYASILGEFMKHEVEIFTPWSWDFGIWETLHLFTKYNQSTSVRAVSTNEDLVSAYPSMNEGKDTMTIILINRSVNTIQNITIDPGKFIPIPQTAILYALYKLPNSETFIADNNNALKSSEIKIANAPIDLRLEPLSVSSITILAKSTITVKTRDEYLSSQISIFPIPAKDRINLRTNNLHVNSIELIDLTGRKVSVRLNDMNTIHLPSALPSGTYTLKIQLDKGIVAKRIIIL